LGAIYGEFGEYKSFAEIINVEYNRWNVTDVGIIQKVERLLKKSKKLTIDDWILAITSYGISPEKLS